MSNGYSPADMSTAAASAHRNGYQAGYSDAVKAYDAAQPAAAQEAVARPEPYIVGNKYRTQAGDLVRFVAVHNEGTSYECMEDEAGVNRYTRRDFGRVTGTCHEYSDPRNTPPLYAAPVAAVPEPSYLEYLDLQNHSLRRAIHAMMAKLVFLLDEDQFADIDAIARAAGVTPAAPGIGLHAPCTEAVYALARKLLWVAYVWNDHNFDHPYKIARKLAAEFGIESFDQANAWLDEQSKLIDASPKGGSDACIWADDGEGNWHTACGDIFTLMEGSPADNKMHHCPYCGKNLQATSAEVGA